MKTYIHLSKRIYNIKRFIDYRRVAVFVARSLWHDEEMKQLIAFFQADPVRRDIISSCPSIYEQATRQWLYRSSKFRDRLAIIKEHFLFFQERFYHSVVREIFIKEGVLLWYVQYEDDTISLRLLFNSGHRKEGLAAIELYLGEKRIYRIIFWVARDSQGETALWIGALQGSPGDQQTFRDLTKYFFGYRTKNLILYGVRTVARCMGLKKIYAVSNYGFYTNNHIRVNRKLKTSLDEFWGETGGTRCHDHRFFELPVVEPRKSLDAVKSHKRNLYAKRYATLDEIDKQIFKGLEHWLMPDQSPLRPCPYNGYDSWEQVVGRQLIAQAGLDT